MNSESKIRRSVKILLETYGALTTTEVKEHLHEVLVFDNDDLEPSNSRENEIRILQRIGNIVSHQKPDVELYEEGFVVDKRQVPAIWILVVGQYGYESTIDDETIARLRERLDTYSPARYKKVNWDEVNERRTYLGRLGEEFVYNLELEHVGNFYPNPTTRVQHLSEYQGDGFGYDILSIDEDGNSKFIEVKTTKASNPNTPFFMSINERIFFEEHINDNAYLYRVYDFDPHSMNGRIMIISAEVLLNDYDFDPISFRVSYRG